MLIFFLAVRSFVSLLIISVNNDEETQREVNKRWWGHWQNRSDMVHLHWYQLRIEDFALKAIESWMCLIFAWIGWKSDTPKENMAFFLTLKLKASFVNWVFFSSQIELCSYCAAGLPFLLAVFWKAVPTSKKNNFESSNNYIWKKKNRTAIILSILQWGKKNMHMA